MFAAPFRLGAIASAIRIALGSSIASRDPQFGSVSLLLHGNGPNASTTIVDSSMTPKTVTANGNAQISTAQSKFGGSSIALDGTGDFLSVPYAPIFDINAGDFTIEGWYYKTGSGSAIISNRNTGATGWALETFRFRGVVNGGYSDTQISFTEPSSNAWHHFALVRYGSSLLYFSDGVLVGTRTGITSIGIDSGQPIRLGYSNSAGEQSFAGYYDDIRWTTGVARYITNFTIPAEEFPDYDPNFSSVSLLLHGDWPNTSTIFIDDSPSPKTPTVTGNAQISTAQSKFGGSSMRFDGAGDAISYASSAAFGLGTGDFTIEGWIYYTGATTGSYDRVFVISPATIPRAEIRFADAGFGYRLQANMGSGLPDVLDSTFTRTNAQNVWTHVALCRSAGTIRFFINGALASSVTASYNLGTSGTCVVGADDSAGNNCFNGYIDEFRVTKGVARYTAAFTPPTQPYPWPESLVDANFANVALLLHGDGPNASTTIVDSSMTPKTITVSGNAQISTAQSRFGGASIAFDGTGDFLSASNPITLTGDFTLEAWLYPTSAPAFADLFVFGDESSNRVSFGTRNGRLAYDIFGGGLEPDFGTATLTLNAWSHVAFVRSGTTLSGYINGTLAGSTTQSGTLGNANALKFGNSFAGYIDDLRVTNGVARYAANFNPPTQPFQSSSLATSGLLMALDARLYASGQTWANQIGSPADGSAQTAYDYNLGGTTAGESSDPGIIGTGTDSAYFGFDGGDFFTHTLAAGSMPAFLRNMHKAGQSWTIEVWMRWDGAVAANIAPLFDSGTSDQGGSDMSRGVIFGDLGNLQQTSGRLRLRIKQDSGGASALAVQSDAAIPSGSVQMLAASYQAGGTSFLYANGAYMQVGAADTFTATLTSPGTTDPANRARIGARGDGGFMVPSGTRVYLVRVYNRALTKAELDGNWSATRGRYGV